MDDPRDDIVPRAGAPLIASADPMGLARALLAEGRAREGLAVLRGLPARAQSRAAAVAATLAASAADPEFRALVQEADAARDRRDFSRGEYLYWRCLQLYPLHHGYLTQYGHCLKEQGKWEDAEAVYRSALALGGPVDDLGRHIAAAARGAVTAPIEAPPTEAACPLDLAPTRDDVVVMLGLFLHRGPASPGEIVTLLRQCATRRAVALALLGHDEFARANRDLMVLLAEGAVIR